MKLKLYHVTGTMTCGKVALDVDARIRADDSTDALLGAATSALRAAGLPFKHLDWKGLKAKDITEAEALRAWNAGEPIKGAA